MSIIDYILQPSTLITIITCVFTLWGIRATLNNRIKSIEERVSKIESYDLNLKILEMQKDIQYIREKLDMFWGFINKKK